MFAADKYESPPIYIVTRPASLSRVSLINYTDCRFGMRRIREHDLNH